ncbi:MAG: leucine-rich repeat domain-containing protein [Kiritimatiellia bacterium]|jgi:hypothetical protein
MKKQLLHTTPATRFRAFALALLAILLPLAASAAGFGGETCGPYTYIIIDDTEAVITHFDDSEHVGDLVITNSLGNKPVTTINNWAFSDCANITAITIPNTVASIGDWAFQGCTSLATITIPDSVTAIGDWAFQYCNALAAVTIPSSVDTIGTQAFVPCPSLTNITVAAGNGTYADIHGVLCDSSRTTLLACPNGRSGAYAVPAGITAIAEEAFAACTFLTTISIHGGVSTIGAAAFDFCNALTSIDVAESNANYASRDGVLFNKGLTTLIQYPNGRPGAYAIPDGVTAIGDWAFHYSALLTAVTLPDTITSIAQSAFAECTALASVSIPGSVTSIEDSAFMNCGALAAITIPGSVTDIGHRAFYNCGSLASVLFTGNRPTGCVSTAFDGASPTIYYLPGTTGWKATFCGRPTALWNAAFSTTAPPQIDDEGAFALSVTGNVGIPVCIEVCNSLATPDWIVLTNTTLSADGALDYTDPDAATLPARFYRFTFPH